MSSLKIKDLSYATPKKMIFKNLNLDIPADKTYLWKGNSGSGKSTLGRIICGHLSMTSGQVILDGNPVLAPGRRLIYLSQHSDLFEWQTVQEHLSFLESHGISSDIDMINEYVDMLELKDLLQSYPKHLSVGQMKRVQILRALIIKPKVMILDETLSALDLHLKNKVLKYLKSQWIKNGTLGIIISHELDKDEYSEIDSTLDFNRFSIA